MKLIIEGSQKVIDAVMATIGAITTFNEDEPITISVVEPEAPIKEPRPRKYYVAKSTEIGEGILEALGTMSVKGLVFQHIVKATKDAAANPGAVVLLTEPMICKLGDGTGKEFVTKTVQRSLVELRKAGLVESLDIPK